MWVDFFLQKCDTARLLFVKKLDFSPFLFNTSYVTKLTPPPLHEGFVPVFLRLNLSQGPIRGAIISSTPPTQLKEKKRFFFKQLLFVIMNLDATSWFYTVFNFDSLWVNFVK
jgi:hypothetical protein